MCSALDRIAIGTHLHQGSGNVMGEDSGRLEDLQDGDEGYEILFSGHAVVTAIMKSQQLRLPA